MTNHYLFKANVSAYRAFPNVFLKIFDHYSEMFYFLARLCYLVQNKPNSVPPMSRLVSYPLLGTLHTRLDGISGITNEGVWNLFGLPFLRFARGSSTPLLNAATGS